MTVMAQYPLHILFLLFTLTSVSFFHIDWIRCEALEQYGSYDVQKTSIRLRGVLHYTSPTAIITYPSDVLDSTNTQKFPLLVFAHGYMAGGLKTYIVHKTLLDGLASFGFIVIAHQSCNFGCPRYFNEIIKLVNYIDSDDQAFNHEVLKFVDRDLGYGILGHSMGGGATAKALEFAEENKIKAGAILHPVPVMVSINVPTAVFTGQLDQCCGEKSSQLVYSGITSPARAFADMVGALHIEPNFVTDWTAHVASWFKVHLVGEVDGYYYDLIYGTSGNSLCSTDSDLPMVQETCEALQ